MGLPQDCATAANLPNVDDTQRHLLRAMMNFAVDFGRAAGLTSAEPPGKAHATRQRLSLLLSCPEDRRHHFCRPRASIAAPGRVCGAWAICQDGSLLQ